MYRQGLLVPAIKNSFWRVTKALGLVALIGIPGGVLMGMFTPMDALLRKIVSGAKSVPPSGILGLVVLWFGTENRGKIVFLFLGAIFFMIILVKNAVRGVSEDYVRVVIDLGASRWQTLRHVLLPGALPQIWDALAVCNGIMWTYIVLVEFLNANLSPDNLGLGVLLRSSQITNHPGEVFATLILIALISSLTDFLFQLVRKIVPVLNW
jgi:ABC-type nitrate/sulfonate/bicarbonate transport system permease component